MKKEELKWYEAPSLEVVELEVVSQLLSASNIDAEEMGEGERD